MTREEKLDAAVRATVPLCALRQIAYHAALTAHCQRVGVYREDTSAAEETFLRFPNHIAAIREEFTWG